MVLCNATVIEQTSIFLNDTQITCGIDQLGEIVFQPNNTKNQLRGFACILDNLIETSQSPFRPKTPVETALLRQWLEYAVCVVNFCDTNSAALNELNNVFAQRSYLIGNRVTVTDAIFYYMLYPFMAELSLQKKEKLRHLCRWFATVQHISGLKNINHTILTFSRNPLYT